MSGPEPAGGGEETGRADPEEEVAEEEEAKEERPKTSGPKEDDGPDVYDPVTAVVQLKIPKVPVEPDLDEDGNPIPVDVNESDLEDIPYEDRCLTSICKQGDQ